MAHRPFVAKSHADSVSPDSHADGLVHAHRTSIPAPRDRRSRYGRLTRRMNPTIGPAPNGGSRSLPVATSGDRFGCAQGRGPAWPLTAKLSLSLGCELSRCPGNVRATTPHERHDHRGTLTSAGHLAAGLRRVRCRADREREGGAGWAPIPRRLGTSR